jgi:subtilase family serine protease
MAYVTSIVLKTLSSYNSVFINQTSITKASAYLLTKQNADGGFGASPSNIYETALSLLSLIESGRGSIPIIQSGIQYLTSTQASDGSWSQDPYYTALALQALAAARPNLTMASNDVSLSKSMPQENETVTITATVHNTGFDTASNIVVRLFLGDPSTGGTQIGTDQVIPSLVVGGAAQASITASFTGTGGKTIFVKVDPTMLFRKPIRRTMLHRFASVATALILRFIPKTSFLPTYVPTSGTSFTLNYTIRNLGESEAGAFVVSLYDGDPSTGSGHLLSTANVSGLNGSEVRTGTLGVTLTTNGNHALYLVADSGNQITEISKTNNTGSVTVNVGGTLTQAELAISSADIVLTPRVRAGDTVTISANVHNVGAEAANNFTLEIFDGSPAAGGSLILAQTVSLVAGGEQAVSTSWSIPAGIHEIFVIADRANQVSETNETNNCASVRVMTDMVDIALTATDLVFTPAHPVNGDSVILSITAHNTGIQDTGAFNLALYDGDPNSGGALLQTFAVSNIPADGNTTLPYTFTAIPWTYRFYAIADTENVITEMYEDNNLAIRSLKIKALGETLGPDLVPVKIDLSGTATDPQTLAISGNSQVFFQNKGDDKITTSFNVLVFEDTDMDGKYTPGVDNLLSTATNTLPLWPEGAGMVSVPLSGTVKFLHSPLYAFVDSGDSILEQDETNNLLISCKDCEVRPTNPIQPVVKWRYNVAMYPRPLLP